ncbi:adenine deaminase [Paenibacillus ginsengarvi]|uniref:Adenine deaminase n=1 Tax=Paenibacillus ginsengarvi TaxID=400777 RepID=A0A3B0ANT1_9BACL|nr:adenine deaminase [Paenibacillus ginsengarvi]RKN62780.1 adenine deaminase [Paenibacillus ginsengarvi]
MNSKLVASARGDLPIELAIENIRLVNVFSGEIYPAAIGITADRIVHVTAPGVTTLEANERINGQGRYAIPGLIDTHLHIEVSMMTPAQYAEAVLPHGTTTIVPDPHEIANVLGERGVRYMADAAVGLDLRMLNVLPSCVPAAPNVETSGADFTPEAVERMLAWDGIHGLAEVMNYHGVIHQDPRMIGILEANERTGGKIVQGHAPRVSGRDLSAYMIAGPNSDHESRTGDEALEKIRAGMIVEIREGSFSMNLADCAKEIKDMGYLPNVCFCSDDLLPSDIIEKGHMNYIVRKAIHEGIDPVHAIRYATLNAALRLERKDLGAIAAGRLADIVLVEQLETMNVTDVFVAGRQVVRSGKLVRKQPELAPPADFMKTVRLAEITEEDLVLRVEDAGASEAKVRVIEYDAAPGIPTDFLETTLPVENGLLCPERYTGKKGPLCRVAVFHRHGLNENRSLGLLAGYGIVEGAVATTVAHDSHNLAVLGVNTADMVIAANTLRESQGGFVAVKNGQVIAHLPLPLAGLMSLEKADVLVPKLKELVDILQKDIMPGKNPIHRMIAVTLPVIPRAKITDIGLVEVETQTLLPLIIETK